MDHFTIFQDFYRVIAEMTEEEIVSAISNGTYRETVEDVRRIFAEQGEKAANEKKIELPEITFSANYRGGRSNATLVKYLGYIVVDIDHQTQEALARILALAKKCAHTRIAFISPKGMGLKIVVRVCRTDGTLPETIQEIEDFHHAAYHKIASFYAQLCGVEASSSTSKSVTVIAQTAPFLSFTYRMSHLLIRSASLRLFPATSAIFLSSLSSLTVLERNPFVPIAISIISATGIS